ncbi:unnamed protein product [Durusdinium trenchii]|uniref:Uncharacterized protein n=1 Tax=Durusdinium trenchii TaxID=1381693 RepID=A0ABP0I5C9_9DINO
MSRGPRAGPGGEDAASAAQSPDSFTDLVHPVPLAPAPVEVEEDLKLCLVLRSGRGDQGLLHSDSGSELEMRLPKEPHGFCARVWRTLLRLCNRRLHAWAWRTANLGVSSLLISLIFFMLILFEGMVSAILVSTFHRLGIGQASGVYLLLPCPLAPLSPLMGLAALVLRRPFLGRLQAQLSLMAVINVVVVGTLYWMPGLLAPLLASGLLHVLVSYFAAIFSGLEMSNADLVMAEDSGDATLASIREASLRAAQTNREEEGICMAILPGRRRARSRADSVESDAPGEQEHGGATPF